MIRRAGSEGLSAYTLPTFLLVQCPFSLPQMSLEGLMSVIFLQWHKLDSSVTQIYKVKVSILSNSDPF